MAVQLKRIAGAVRQGGKLIPLYDGDPVPEPAQPEGLLARAWGAVSRLWRP